MQTKYFEQQVVKILFETNPTQLGQFGFQLYKHVCENPVHIVFPIDPSQQQYRKQMIYAFISYKRYMHETTQWQPSQLQLQIPSESSQSVYEYDDYTFTQTSETVETSIGAWSQPPTEISQLSEDTIDLD